MARYCANCGTEVEDTAVFCPTCGQPIDQASETQIPAAPAWPDQATDRAAEAPSEAATPDNAGSDRFEEPTRVEEASAPPAERDASLARAAQDRPAQERPAQELPAQELPAHDRPTPDHAAQKRPGQAPINLPFTMPLTLSAWLIGGGTAVAALGVIIGLFGGFLNPIDLILLLALIGIAVTVFFSASVPTFANLKLVTLVIVLIGFGIALDRIGFGRAGIGALLLFLGTAAAAIGAILLELGRDQPLGGPGR
ncbi:MAG: zinc-ribbon domain-containing protein [Candidatus Limnocylindria bacterium]